MECFNCQKENKGNCIIEVLLGVIAGVAVGILFANSLIPVTLVLIIVSLIVSVIGLAILIGSLFTANLLNECNNFKKCLCRTSKCLLTSSIGTLLAGTIALIIGVTTVSVASILAVGFTAFFFIWLIASIVSLILCLIKETCK